MPHVLVITDAKGTILAKVKVDHGYRIREMRESEAEKIQPPAIDKSTGDSGTSKESIS